VLPWRWRCSTHDGATPNETTTTLDTQSTQTHRQSHKHIRIHRKTCHSLSSLSTPPFLLLSLCVCLVLCMCKPLYLRLPAVRVVACIVLHWWPHAAATTLALHWPRHGNATPPPPQPTTHHHHSTLTHTHTHTHRHSQTAPCLLECGNIQSE
jgi:hypothetical protein